jgi:hypothetical protein
MKQAFMRFPLFFLGGYKDYPREIQQKMLNLFSLCTVTSIIFAFMLIRAVFFTFDHIEALSSIYCIAILLSSLVFIRLKKPIFAENLSICMIFYVLGNYILRDLFSSDSKQISRINDSGVVIIFGIIITTTYIIQKSQYLFLIFTSYILLISHYLVLVFHYYHGMFEDATVVPFLETLAIISISLFLSYSTLLLTTRERGQVFTNIVFYKLNKQGPVVAYSEHPLHGHEENCSGAYFYTAIGQGAQYATGLFGPIPFGLKEEGKVALIFATRAVDTGLTDQRLNCQNYLLVGLITTSDKISILNRESLEKRLAIIIREIPDLCALSSEQYAKLVTQIRAI